MYITQNKKRPTVVRPSSEEFLPLGEGGLFCKRNLERGNIKQRTGNRNCSAILITFTASKVQVFATPGTALRARPRSPGERLAGPPVRCCCCSPCCPAPSSCCGPQPLSKWTLFQARGRSALENPSSSYVKWQGRPSSRTSRGSPRTGRG